MRESRKDIWYFDSSNRSRSRKQQVDFSVIDEIGGLELGHLKDSLPR